MSDIRLPSYTTGAQHLALIRLINEQQPRAAKLIGFRKDGSALILTFTVSATEDEQDQAQHRVQPYSMEYRVGQKGAIKKLRDFSPEERARQREIAKTRRERLQRIHDKRQQDARFTYDGQGNLTGMRWR